MELLKWSTTLEKIWILQKAIKVCQANLFMESWVIARKGLQKA